MMTIHAIATIGYEKDTVTGVIDRLREAEIDIVIDVRAVASSRRAGFSKTILAATLKEASIAYRHLRALGTPKPGRIAARAGRIDEMRQIFAAHLAEPEAQMALNDAAEIARTGKAALLCFEHDAACCHRAMLADEIHRRLGYDIVDL